MKAKDLQIGKYYWCKIGTQNIWRIVTTFIDDDDVPCIASFLSEKPIPILELEEDLYEFEEAEKASEVKEKLYRFFQLLNSADTNDEGYLRRHVNIGCSRIMVGEELSKVLKELEAYCGYSLPQWQVDLIEEARKEREHSESQD